MTSPPRSLAVLVTLSLIFLPGTEKLSAQSPEALRANQKALDDLTQNVLRPVAAGKPVSWSVVRKWVELRTMAPDWPSQRLVKEGSDLIRLDNRAAWYADARQKLEASRNTIRLGLTATAPTVNILLMDYQNTEFANLQAALEANARVRIPDNVKRIQAAASAVRIAATRAILPGTATKELLLGTKDASRELDKLVNSGTAAAGNSLDVARAKAETIVANLSNEAQTYFSSLPDGIGKYREIAAVGIGLADSLTTQTRVTAVKVEDALKLVNHFGDFERAQDDLVANFAKQSQAVQDSLSKDLDDAQKAWPRLLNDALAARGTQGQIPEEVKRVASFAEQFSQLRDVLQGRTQGLGTPAAVAMLNFGIAQTHLASPELVQNLAALATTKGDYASAALGLASSLGLHPPPEIQSALPLLSTAAMFMTGAGPLAAISGLAGGGGALSFLGGFGGGKDYSADFAKIEAELAQINQRLDRIENKLDALAQQIKADHQEVMSALEAISFDVARTHELLLSQDHIALRRPCLLAINSPAQVDPIEAVTNCDKQLDGVLLAEDTPTLFTLETNLVTAGLKDSALAASTREKFARATLSKLARGNDCGGLFYPSSTIDDLTMKSQASTSKPTECDEIMTKRKLLEPGIVSLYVNEEQDALLASYRSKTGAAWWSQHADSVRRRWNHELQLLDDAVAQQTIMVGDVVLPQLAKVIEAGGDLSAVTGIWGETTGGILAENVARYWMHQKIGNNTAARTLYGTAWYSNDERFWYALTGAAPDKVRFSQEVVKRTLPNGETQEEKTWFVTFTGLAKVPLPQPKEWMHFELRWTNALTDLVDSRRRLIDEMSGMDYLTGLRRTGKALDLLQVFALATSK